MTRCVQTLGETLASIRREWSTPRSHALRIRTAAALDHLVTSSVPSNAAITWQHSTDRNMRTSPCRRGDACRLCLQSTENDSHGLERRFAPLVTCAKHARNPHKNPGDWLDTVFASAEARAHDRSSARSAPIFAAFPRTSMRRPPEARL